MLDASNESFRPFYPILMNCRISELCGQCNDFAVMLLRLQDSSEKYASVTSLMA